MARPMQGRLASLPGRLYNQGLAKARAEDWQGAQQDLAAALALDPGLTSARVLLGKVLARLDRLEEAAQCWRETLAQEPEHATARAALGRAQEILRQRQGRGHGGWGLGAGLALAAFLVGAAGMAAWQQAQGPPAAAVAAVAQPLAAPALPVLAPAPPPLATPAAVASALEAAPVAPADPRWEAVLAVLNEPALAKVQASWREGRLCLSGRVARQSDHRRAMDLASALAGGPTAVEAGGLLVSGGLEYTVQRGDSLWGLARRFYGQGRAWGHLAEHNPGQGRDPLAVGSRLVIPPHPRWGLRSEHLPPRPGLARGGGALLARAQPGQP